MTAGQIAAPRGGIRVPIVTALVVAALAVGGLAGLAVPRASGGSTVGGAGSAAEAARLAARDAGVATNNMSDAVRAEQFAGAAAARDAGVATNNMSDAVRAEQFAGRPQR